jgi:thiamine pyrophosphate-dependent acetolactate synthase large subunit-like protein
MTGTLSRIELMHGLTAILRDEAVIAGIGNTNFDLYAAGHRPQNFYMLGSMGLALPIAFGVALAQPQRRVIGIEGDGSLLMDLGCLATIAMVAPPNLTLVVMDNAVYEITGGQPTASAQRCDLVAVARAAGIAHGDWAQDTTDFVRLMHAALERTGPSLIGARIERGPAIAQPPRDPAQIRDRFMQAMGSRREFGA